MRTNGLTIDDYESLPDDLALNHELVEGELIDVSGNHPDHNSLRDEIMFLLLRFVRERKLGKVISEQEYRFGSNAHGPDVTFFGTEKLALVHRHLRVQLFVPDLAIEIPSPSDNVPDFFRKIERYRVCGTKEVWVFLIETRQAFRFSDAKNEILGENDMFQPDLIPGFAVRIGELFDAI